jgi:hypothetical protein
MYILFTKGGKTVKLKKGKDREREREREREI